MSRIQRLWHGFLRNAGGGLAAVLLFALMMITCADVIGRYFLGTPLVGAFEMTEIAMALLIYAVLPLVTVEDEHVTIDLLDRFLPEGWRRVQQILVKSVCAALLLLVAWAVLRKAQSVAAAGIRTDSLHIPMAPTAYFIGLVTLLTGAVLVLAVLAMLRRNRPGRSDNTQGPGQ